MQRRKMAGLESLTQDIALQCGELRSELSKLESRLEWLRDLCPHTFSHPVHIRVGQWVRSCSKCWKKEESSIQEFPDGE